jgi:hypothetical protein
VPSDSWRVHGLSLILKLLFGNVFQSPAFKAEIGKHLFGATIFILRIFDFLNISYFHPAIFCFPILIAGFRDTGFAADILNGTFSFDGLQNGNDLVVSESGFTQGELLRRT